MLLRRLMQHLKDRSQFAVGLDPVIAVLGDFIGIQVSNRNDERKLAAEERSYLGQVRGEILGNHGVVDPRVRYDSHVVATSQRGLAFLDTGTSSRNSLRPVEKRCAATSGRKRSGFCGLDATLFSTVSARSYRGIARRT